MSRSVVSVLFQIGIIALSFFDSKGEPFDLLRVKGVILTIKYPVGILVPKTFMHETTAEK